MAKIVIGVNGDGLGHATRSRELIWHLKKKHIVKIFAGTKAYSYLKKYYTDAHELLTTNLVYGDNRVYYRKTFFSNIALVLKNRSVIRRTYAQIKEFNPDIILTDFEPITMYSSLLLRKPCITVDNQHIISKTRPKFPKMFLFDYLNTRLVIKIFGFHAKYYCIPTFFYPQIKDAKNTFLLPPIVRREIRGLKPKKGSHILVYQTSTTYHKLFPVLKEIPEKFIIYGYDQETRDKNLTFRKFNERRFFTDFATCKAVIANGGMSTIVEALYLGKPILSVPIEKTFEQILNALYLDKLGYGEYHHHLDREIISAFLERLSYYEKNLKTYTKKNPDDFPKKVNSLINSVVTTK
jgi:uncharacterized protein (TIGR00661 family)